MKHAIVEAGVVTNIVVADPEFGATQGWVACPGEVSIGWAYDGTNWTAPSAPTVPVPSTVTMRQARLALLQSGKLADVDTAIAAMPSPEKEQAQIEWEYATEVRRNSALVAQLAPALGLDEAALDGLFVTANQL